MVIFEFLQDVAAALEYWLLEKQALYDDPADGVTVPPATAVAQILRTIEQSAEVELQRPLGSGEYGLAFLASNDKVVKVLVGDPGEASAWHMLKGHKLRNLPQVYGAWRLASSAVESDLYATMVEYIPDPIDNYCGSLLKLVTKEALSAIADDVLANARFGDAKARRFAKAFYDYAQYDKRLSDLAALVRDLESRYGIALVDFSADNVRQRKDKSLVVIDLSWAGFRKTPQTATSLVYEQQLRLANRALPVLEVQ